MIYTTNWIERLQRDFRRVLRMHGAMPNEESVIVLMAKTAMVDVLPSVNEGDSMGFNKPWAVLPHGLLQVPAADRFCGSLHRLAPSVRRLKCS
jgi:hypothetical protein